MAASPTTPDAVVGGALRSQVLSDPYLSIFTLLWRGGQMLPRQYLHIGRVRRCGLRSNGWWWWKCHRKEGGGNLHYSNTSVSELLGRHATHMRMRRGPLCHILPSHPLSLSLLRPAAKVKTLHACLPACLPWPGLPPSPQV